MAPVNNQQHYSQYGGSTNNNNYGGHNQHTDYNDYSTNNDYNAGYGYNHNNNGYNNNNNYNSNYGGGHNSYDYNNQQQQHNGYPPNNNNHNGYGQVPQVDADSISTYYDGRNNGETTSFSGGHHPSSAAYGEPGQDSSKDYGDLYANVKEDEQKLNLGDYVTGMEPGDGGIPGGMTTITVLVLFSVLCILICIFGLITLLKKRSPDSETYSAAVQNRYFTADNKEMSCLNCRLIEMGSMACYQELCPQCGRPPPNR